MDVEKVDLPLTGLKTNIFLQFEVGGSLATLSLLLIPFDLQKHVYLTHFFPFVSLDY